MSKIKITHIITGLNMGGAETMLYKLLENIDKTKYEINVISMMDEGVYGSKIRDLGIEVYTLNMNPRLPSLTSILKARKLIKNADVVQTWLYHADFFGYVITRFFKHKKLIWGIRHSNLDPDKNKRSTLAIAKINAKVSKNVDYVISNSYKAKESHFNIGFSMNNFKIIPNGFELKSFYKISGARKKLNQMINNVRNLPIIAHVGRWDKLKDYPNLLKSLFILKQHEMNYKTVLCGTNIDYNNAELVQMINEYGLKENIKLLGRRNDIPLIMAGADLFVLSSSGEGFPNVVGEAMACETPCVVTDVGDTEQIVGKTGLVVPPSNSKELASGMMQLLELTHQEREKLGKLARDRVIQHYSIEKVVKQFEELYKKIKG